MNVMKSLPKPEYSARGMMRRYHVETVCTTDDPVIHWNIISKHVKRIEIKMLPTWRRIRQWQWEVPADFSCLYGKIVCCKRCHDIFFR